MQKAAKLPKSKAQGKEKQSHKNKAKKENQAIKTFRLTKKNGQPLSMDKHRKNKKGSLC